MLPPVEALLTPEGNALYIAGMSNDVGNERFELELKRLEKRLDELVDICKKLQEENESLRNRQDVLTAERATLLQKNEQVRTSVEAMIGRLRLLETGA